MAERHLKAVKKKSANKEHELLNFFDYVVSDSPDSIQLLVKRIHELANDKRIVFVSGNFNIVHPGHLRLLNFAAECGDFLVVGVNQDTSPGILVPQHLRLEGVRSINGVDLALPLPIAPEDFLAYLKPNIVVKGSEHQQHFNPEQSIVDAYGGKLLFSSGEMRFASIDLLRAEMQEVVFSTIKKPIEYLERHHIHPAALPKIVQKFADLSVVVLGDLIIDEYITCDPLGISREDPTIVVTPIKRDLFLGGAGIVAAHARSLGAKVKYFSVIGKDDAAKFALDSLKKFDVDTCLLEDNSRPTTLKQRFRADSKTLLRVSHLRHHHVASELTEKMLKQISKIIKQTDLLVFSDFNYGCLPQSFVDEVINLCEKQSVPMVADSQASSQIGDVSRFKGMKLITPTEHEARLALRDQASGLSVIAESLSQKANAEHVFITLGAEGLLVHSPHTAKNEFMIDQLPAFNSVPKDISGGGDSLLIMSSLALAAGANIWECAYLGSLAAACHVARIGNLPLSINDVLQELYL
jgi:rfaE bifunctional protein kinase chain/domain